MHLKSAISKRLARWVVRRLEKVYDNPVDSQIQELRALIRKGKNTTFGKAHQFEQITSYDSFKNCVPIRDYEGFRDYIERIVKGEKDVLWPGLPMYFCKTSGTTSGTKYIPLTKDSLPNHLNSARNALLCYIDQSGDASFVKGKMIFLQGSPELEYLESAIPYGRLSGIVANHVPGYLQKNRMPSYETNCIEDWETKVNAIVDETIKEDMTLISGIPSWVLMYFEKLIEKSGKNSVAQVFPNFSLFVFGGVNFEPYRATFQKLIGKDIPSVELFPASEGFIAYQDSQQEKGMRLVLNSGIFYEFIPMDKYHEEHPPRIMLDQVELGVNYALILSNNAGLWAYNIGDTVKFVSLSPPRVVVTGRIKHFISAFGEHVIAEEVEDTMRLANDHFGFHVNEFHVAPQVNPPEGLPYHEWFIEMAHIPDSLIEVVQFVDGQMQKKNTYYKDLRVGNILKEVRISILPAGSFQQMMKARGKLGGQNKVPRLGNDRVVADVLEQYMHQ